MPEFATAHTHVQRALHALILEDGTGAAGYLRRALTCLEEEEGGVGSRRRRRGSDEVGGGGRSVVVNSTFQWD